MKKSFGGIYLFIFLICYSSFCQTDTTQFTRYQKDNHFTIKRTTLPIKLDGILDDSAWESAEVLDSFWRKFPDDFGRSKVTTKVRILYDDKNIYFGFFVKDSHKPFIQSLKRDGGHDGNDCIAIILDPLNKHLNGYFFVLNSHNAQSEDQKITNGGNGLNWSWDTKWHSATKHFDGYWVAEVAIPFKSIRYDKSSKVWGINFIRVDTRGNEYSTWTHLPLNFPSHDLGYTGAMVWSEDPPSTKQNISLIPYISGGAFHNQDVVNDPLTGNVNLGLDAKIALNSSLNLDLTVNPDFSQIEVDQQVTNLTRFSIFYPEKRTFFLENADLFANYGIEPIRPFYSRTIGLSKSLLPLPIIAGARITGSLNPKTRIGILNIQTGSSSEVDDKPQNFTAISVHRQILKRSTIKGYFLNHENFLNAAENQANPLDRYGRNAGVDFNYSNTSGTFNAWFNYNYSIKPQLNYDNVYTEAGFEINRRNFGIVTDFASVGQNYYTDMGFVQRIENFDASRDTSLRLGFKHWFQNFTYRIVPKKGAFTTINFEVESYNIFNATNYQNSDASIPKQLAGVGIQNQSFNESSNEFNVDAMLKNTSNLFVGYGYNYVNLLYATSFTDGDPLPIGKYFYSRFYAGYRSDFRKNFSFRLSGSYGNFYNGLLKSATIGLNYRIIPRFNFSLNINYNRLDFPGTYGSSDLFLVGSRIEINFSTKIFWNTFIQYNTQTNNFNINSRFQYRFKPLSDLFIVYTDNYYADLSQNKNRALVFKINYWFNL